MNAFTAALAAFVLIHVGLSATGLRRLVVARIGEWPYRGLFSVLSLVLLVWMIMSYGDMRADATDRLNLPFWAPPDWLRHITHTLAVIGVTFVVAGALTPGPTYAGFEAKALAEPEPARGMLRITRHPFLWGVAIWALGHLLINGERFALMLFGALGLMVLLGTRSIDRKGRARDPEGFARFEAATSNIPFAAIVQGRNKLVLGEIWWRLLVGLAAALAFGFFHGQIIGVPAFRL